MLLRDLSRRISSTESRGKLEKGLCDPISVVASPVSQLALVVKNPPAVARDTRDGGSVPRLGRSPGGGNGSPLQCSCLGKSMDRAAWQATVHGVAKRQTRLSD